MAFLSSASSFGKKRPNVPFKLRNTLVKLVNSSAASFPHLGVGLGIRQHPGQILGFGPRGAEVPTASTTSPRSEYSLESRAKSDDEAAHPGSLKRGKLVMTLTTSSNFSSRTIVFIFPFSEINGVRR